MDQRAKKILDYLSSEENHFIAFLQKMVRVETPSTQPETMDRFFSIISEAYSDIDYRPLYLPGNSSGGQLLLQPQKRDRDKPIQLLLGHCDTVWPLGTLEKMPCMREGNTLTGPGVYDMKAGLGMMLFALKAVQHLEADLPVTPIVFINSDEELSSEDSRQNIIRLAKCASRVFVLEPSLGKEGKIKTERKGVGHFEITVTGKAAHAGLDPESGISAIHGLSQVVQELFELNDPANGTTVNVGTIQGGERTNVVAATGKAAVDVRVKSEKAGRRIEKAIRNLKADLPGIELQIEGGIERPPMQKTETNKKLWQRTRELGKTLELELKEGLSGGASDGNYTNMHAPTIDGLGAVGEGAHATHERIYIKETLQRCALLSLLLLEPADNRQ